MLKRWLAMGLIVMAAGCETYTKLRHEPPVCPSKTIPPEPGTDPATLKDATVIRPTSQPAAKMTLEACIRAALDRNGRIRIADRQILIAQDRVREAWAIDLPKLTAEGRFDIQEKNAGSAAFSAAAAAGQSSSVPKLDRDVASTSMTLLVPVYNFGFGYHQREAARLGVDVASLSARRVEQDLILDVKQSYFRVLEAQKIRDVVRDSILTVTRQLEVARDFYQQGLVAKNDVLVVEVQLAERNLQLIQADNNIQLAMATLDRLIGEPVTRDLLLDDILETAPWTGRFEEVFFLAVRERPDLAALRKQIRIVDEQYRSTRATLAPRIDAYANYSYSDSNNVSDHATFTGGLVANWSIFDGGLTWAQLARLSKEINQAVDQQSEAEKDIILQVKQAYLNLTNAAKGIPVARKSIELAEENLRITRDQYAQGLLISEDVLLQEERLAQARSSYYRALYAYHQSSAVLTNAVGTELPAARGASHAQTQPVR